MCQSQRSHNLFAVSYGLPLSHIPLSLLHNDVLSMSLWCFVEQPCLPPGFPGQSSFRLPALVILQLDNACIFVSLTHLIFNASVIFM